MKKILGLSAIGALMSVATVAHAIPNTANFGFEEETPPGSGNYLGNWSTVFSASAAGGQTNAGNAVVSDTVGITNGAIPPGSYSPFSPDYGDRFLALRTPDDGNDTNSDPAYEGPVQSVSRDFVLQTGETLLLEGVAAFDWGDVIDIGVLIGGLGVDAARVELTNPGGTTETVLSFSGDVTAGSEDWVEWSRTLTQAGTWTLTFAVNNTFNNRTTSMGVFDLKAPVFTPASPPPPNPTPSVPEPGVLALLGLGLAGLGYGRRRVKS